jgi:glutamate decarboxylase
VLSDIHRQVGTSGSILDSAKAAVGFDQTDVESYEPGLPVVAFRFSDQFKADNPNVQQKWMQTLLRAKGWIVPNYELAPDLESVDILRVVVRESMTEELVDRLVSDLVELTEGLTKSSSPEHALAILGSSTGSKATKSQGRQDGHLDGHASHYNGTYAKQC